MAMFDTSTIAAAANADGEFQLAARRGNANLRFDVGDDLFGLRVRNWRGEEFAGIAASDVWRVQAGAWISAPAEDWRELLKPVPKPFFQDLMAAIPRENFKLEGDLTGFHPYYL